jgi:hypothetical protein
MVEFTTVSLVGIALLVAERTIKWLLKASSSTCWGRFEFNPKQIPNIEHPS